MEMVRSFLAVPIPAEVRKLLADIEKPLIASGADVKWVPEPNFHVTMKFLGNVEAEKIEPVAEAVGRAVRDIPPFEVALSGMGAFPNTRRPSVVWVGISSGGDRLKELADRIDRELEALGFAREAREFSPHVTIGRAKTPRNADKLREAIEKQRETGAGTFRVERIAVMKSELRPSGPIYTEITSRTLHTG